MADPTDVKPNGEGEAPAAPSTVEKPAAPSGGEGAPAKPDEGQAAKPAADKGGKPAADTMVPKARLDAEVSRWKKRALDSEVRAKANEVVQPADAGKPAAAGEGGEGKPDSSEFVTKADLAREKLVDTMVSEGRRCIEQFDGTNGWPKFDLDEVSAHMKRTGGTSYEAAYRELHFDEIVEAEKAKAVEEASKKNVDTTVADGGSALGQPPAGGALTREKVKGMDPKAWEKMGGSKNPDIKKAMLHGQLK